MNKKKYISLFFTFIAAFILAENIFAQSPYVNQSMTIFADTTSDLSLSYLRDIFGNVGPLHGNTNMFVGTIFSLFNLGMVSFVAAFAGYTGIYASLSAAADGSAIGQKVKMWTVVRMSVGAASLAPMTTGYSSLQILIMWVVVQGVSVADAMWARALDYIEQMQGTVFSDPTAQQYQDMDTLINQETGKMNAKVLMQAALCNRHHYYEGYTLENAKTNQTYDLRFGVMCTPNQEPSSNTVQVCFGSKENPTECGSFVYTSKSTSSIVIESMQNAMYGMASIVTNTVNTIYDRLLYAQLTAQVTQSSPPPPDLVNCHIKMQNGELNRYPGNCMLANTMVSAASTYYSLSKVARVASSVDKSSADTSWMSGSKDNGWASAGFFYSQLMRNNANTCSGSSCEQGNLPNIGNFMASAKITPPKIKVSGTTNNQIFTYLSGGIEGKDISFVSFARQIVAGMKEANDPLRSEQKMVDVQIPEFSSFFMPTFKTEKRMVDQIEDPVFDYAASMLINTLVVAPDNMDIDYNQATLSMFGVANYALMNIMNALADIVGTFSGINVSQVMPPTYNQPITFNPSCLSLSSCGTSSHSGCMFEAIKSGCISGSGIGLLSAIAYESKNNKPISPLVTVSKMGDAFFRAGVSYIFYTNSAAYENLTNMAGIMTGYQVASLIVAAIIGGMFNTFSEEGAAYFMTFLANDLYGFFSLLYQIAFQFMMMFVSTGTTLAIMMFGMGSTLSIYLPLLPFVIYTMAVISWFMVVIEAMVAAPIISLGLAHPSNNQYIGSTEQGIMLLFMVLTRPSVMLLGLIFSIMVAHVSMRIVNYAFMFLIGQTYHSLVIAGSNDGIAGFMISFALMLVYTYVCFVVLNYCFQLIHQLPERINRWLGGGQMAFGGGDITMMSSGIQQGITESVQGIARGAQFNISRLRPVDVGAAVKLSGLTSFAQRMSARATLAARQFQYRQFMRDRSQGIRGVFSALRNDPRQLGRDIAAGMRDRASNAYQYVSDGVGAMRNYLANGMAFTYFLATRNNEGMERLQQRRQVQSERRSQRLQDRENARLANLKSLEKNIVRPEDDKLASYKARQYLQAGVAVERLIEVFTLRELVKAGLTIKQIAESKAFFQRKYAGSLAQQMQDAGIRRGEMLKYNYWAERNGASKIDGANHLRAYDYVDKFEIGMVSAGAYLAQKGANLSKIKEAIVTSSAYLHENYIKVPEGKLPMDKRFFEYMDQNKIIPDVGPATTGEAMRSAYYAYGRAVRKIPGVGQFLGFLGVDNKSMEAHNKLSELLKTTPRDGNFVASLAERSKGTLDQYTTKQLERAGASATMIKAIKGESAVDPLRDTFVGRMRNAYNSFFYGSTGVVADLVSGRMRSFSRAVRGTNTPLRQKLQNAVNQYDPAHRLSNQSIKAARTYHEALENEDLTSLQRAGIDFDTMKRAVGLKLKNNIITKGECVTQLKSLGYSNREIMRLGAMEDAGLVRNQLNSYRNGQLSFDELRQGNQDTSAKTMMRAGASITEMKEMGYNASDLHAAGFGAAEIKKVYPSQAEMDPGVLSYTQHASNMFTGISSGYQSAKNYAAGLQSATQELYNTNMKWSDGAKQTLRSADAALQSGVNRDTAIGLVGKGVVSSVTSISNGMYTWWMGSKKSV